MKIKLYIYILLLLSSCQNNKTCFSEKNEGIFDILNIEKNQKPKIFFSLDPECPLSKSYSKTINALEKKYETFFDFYGFFPSTVFSEKKISEFVKKYNLNMQLIIDTNHVLTNFLDAQITPECFLTDSNFTIIYRGLIDDWIKELGRKRTYIENNYLEDNMNFYLYKQPIKTKRTKAIGCIIQR